jgi:hypothetical protein
MNSLIAYVGYCVEQPFNNLVCRDFWTWTSYAALGLGLWIALAVVRRLLRHYLEFRRNRLRLEARKVVDFDAIDEASWKGDQLEGDPHELSQDELAARIREAMDARGQVKK